MGDRNWVRLFLVRSKDQIVSAEVAFTFGDTIRLWKVGWSGDYREKKPNHFMRWSIILWAKENGFRELDFFWVDERDAVLLGRGKKDPEAFHDGSTFFKMGFGGRLVMIPHPRSCFVHPLLRVLPRGWLASLIQASRLRRTLSYLWHKNQSRKALQ